MSSVIKVYPVGFSTGIPPFKNDHIRAKRGACGGWSESSTRSNTRFLYSIRENGLIGQGFAVTLTLRDCPGTHKDWHSLRDTFFKRLNRLGMIRAHWVTEWQRRGVPHLHCALWFDDSFTHAGIILLHWTELASSLYGASLEGQHLTLIHNATGWFKYLSKHASRGLQHYQRSSESIPEGWKKTGRMWGYLGDWPRDEPMVFRPSFEAFYQFRRIVVRMVQVDARASGDKRR